MNGWNPQVPPDGSSMFGMDRNVDIPPVRFRGGPPPRRGFFRRLRDAWHGMVDGFRYGPLE